MKLMNNDFIQSSTVKLGTVHDHFTKCFFESILTEKFGENSSS